MKPQVKVQLDKEAGPALEQFIKKLGCDWAPGKRRTSFTIEDLGKRFYRNFNCFVPVSQRLDGLLYELGIERIGKDDLGGLDGAFTYDHEASSWEIHTKCDLGLGFSTTVLHELFEIIFWRAYHRIDWWREWAEKKNIVDPHFVADRFAWSVILPSHEVRRIALECGFNPVELALRFQIYPSNCLDAIVRCFALPHPYFHVVLANPGVQDAFNFDEAAYTRRIKKKAFKAGPPDSDVRWPEMHQLSKSIPKRDKVIPICLRLRKVFQSQQPFRGAMDCILDVKLSTPVYVAANPDPMNRGKLYVQVVPLDSRYMLQPESPEQASGNPIPPGIAFVDHISRQRDPRKLPAVGMRD